MFKLLKKKKYRYEVRATYKNKNYDRVFDFTFNVGLSRQSDIINYKKVKKSVFNKRFGIYGLENDYIRRQINTHPNGIIGIEVLAYLGKF